MEVPIPFIDMVLDLTDPVDAGKTFVVVGLGFVLFYVASALGREGANNVLEASGMQDDGNSVEVL